MYKKQHVISQVLLRRFVAPSSHNLIEYDVVTGEERERKPRSVGYVKNFLRFRASDSERRWQEVENEAQRVFDALDDRSLLTSDELKDIARKLLALHWARSKMLKTIHSSSVQRTLEKRKLGDHFSKETLVSAFRDRFGIEPTGPESLQIIAEEIVNAASQNIDMDAFFHDRVHENYESALNRLKLLGIQVAEASNMEFVLGDVPVLTVRRNFAGVGPLGGVPWDEADAILMTAGPRHMIGIGSIESWLPVDTAAVRMLNSAQIAGAQRNLYYRPGSGLRALIQELRPT